jgi:hypothetical protein
MPVSFHVALRETTRTQQPTGERALLEQRARLALADERRQRPNRGGESQRRSETAAATTALRVVCAIGLVLVALAVLSSQAWAIPGSWPQVAVGGDEMRSGGGQIVAMSSTPGSGHHYTGHQVAIQPTETSIQPGESFDWADASVGAGIAVMLGVLIGGAAWVSNWRRVRGGLTASGG